MLLLVLILLQYLCNTDIKANADADVNANADASAYLFVCSSAFSVSWIGDGCMASTAAFVVTANAFTITASASAGIVTTVSVATADNAASTVVVIFFEVIHVCVYFVGNALKHYFIAIPFRINGKRYCSLLFEVEIHHN